MTSIFGNEDPFHSPRIIHVSDFRSNGETIAICTICENVKTGRDVELGGYAAATDIPPGVKGTIKRRNGDPMPAAGSVDEVAIAQVDTDVIGISEKDEVAGLEVAGIDTGDRVIHLSSGSR